MLGRRAHQRLAGRHPTAPVRSRAAVVASASVVAGPAVTLAAVRGRAPIDRRATGANAGVASVRNRQDLTARVVRALDQHRRAEDRLTQPPPQLAVVEQSTAQVPGEAVSTDEPLQTWTVYSQ